MPSPEVAWFQTETSKFKETTKAKVRVILREECGVSITRKPNRRGRYFCVHAKHYTWVIYLLPIEYAIKDHEIVLKLERINWGSQGTDSIRRNTGMHRSVWVFTERNAVFCRLLCRLSSKTNLRTRNWEISFQKYSLNPN